MGALLGTMGTLPGAMGTLLCAMGTLPGAMGTLPGAKQRRSSEWDSGDEECFSSDDEGQGQERTHVTRTGRTHRRRRTERGRGTPTLALVACMPPIRRSHDLASRRYHHITQDLFVLRECPTRDSRDFLDETTRQWRDHFARTHRPNMAFLMMLAKSKNLYFRKDYDQGISFLEALQRDVTRHLETQPLKDETFIQGRIACNLAYAYCAIQKYDSAQQNLDIAKLQLQHTEGGEDMADVFYCEGKILDFLIQNGSSDRSALKEMRMRAVDAYQRSRDHVLQAPRDDYVTQRAMYRNLSMCKVHLDFPDVDACQSRDIVTVRDLELAAATLHEIDSHMRHTAITPRFNARFLLTTAELSFRRCQLQQQKSSCLAEALADINNACNHAIEAHSLVTGSGFAEEQTAQKMMTSYGDISDSLEHRLAILDSVPKANRKSQSCGEEKQRQGEAESGASSDALVEKDLDDSDNWSQFLSDGSYDGVKDMESDCM